MLSKLPSSAKSEPLARTPAFISSRSINGWSIDQALRRLGHSGEGWCFFTEESSLLSALQDRGARYRFKPQMRDDLIDDKWRFCCWLRDIGERPIPSALSLDSSLHYPIVLKSRHSWKHGSKLPRGWVCANEADVLERLKDFDRLALQKDWFFFQEYLSGETLNVSVSGYYDAKRPHRTLTMTTVKVVGSDRALPTGVVVEVIADPAGLTERTLNILRQLEYDGPFEMEFLRCSGGEFFVLELNPRFWMQHALFTEFAANGLVKRYLDLDGEKDWQMRTLSDHVVWINSIEVLQRVVRGSFGILRTILSYRERGARLFFVPSWRVASRHVANRIFRKLGLQASLDLF